MNIRMPLIRPNLDSLRDVILGSHGDETGVDADRRFAKVGEELLASVQFNNLDHDAGNLQWYARAVACELLDPKIRQQQFYNHQWDRIDLPHRINGRDLEFSEVKTTPKMKVLLAITVLTVLKFDPGFEKCASELLQYAESHSLWTSEDKIDRD